MHRPPALQVQHLYRHYGPHCAVDDVSFELARGEVLGLLGLNGAGKSSTLQMLSGSVGIEHGQVAVVGLDLAKHPLKARAHLGYLPELPPLYPHLTVDEYLVYAAQLRRMRRASIKHAVDQVKQRCGLEAVGGKLIGQLSKGYQQRTGIAQAIVHGPDVVLLDEPTVGLDPAQIRGIRALIRTLGEDHGVILSSHILPEVEAVCTRVLILHRGKTVFSDRLENLAHGHSTFLRLQWQRPPSLERLRALPGIERVERATDGRFRLHHDAAHSPSEHIVQLSASEQWGLKELLPEHKSLEQVFIELTCGEAATMLEHGQVA